MFYCLFFIHHFQMLKQKVYLLIENLDQLNDLSLHFEVLILVLIDIYSNSSFFENLILIVLIILYYLELTK